MGTTSEKKVEPMDVDENKVDEKKIVDSPPEPTPQDIDNMTVEKLKEQCRSLERGEAIQEMGNAARVLRTLVKTRKRLNDSVMTRLISSSLQHSSHSAQKDMLIKFIAQPQRLNIEQVQGAAGPSKSPRQLRKAAAQAQTPTLPEVEVYVHLLTMLYLFDNAKLAEAQACGDALMLRVDAINRRSLDPLAAKCYYFYSLVYDKIGKLEQIQPVFHARLRAANSRYWDESVSVLINCILRGYIKLGLHSMAKGLIAKVHFPEHSNNNEYARFMYYSGRIRAVELDYDSALSNLQQALRKAPQHTAVGFKQSVQKLLIVVELLMGEIPERSLFRMPIYKKALIPYLKLTQAVRTGDLQKFSDVLKTNLAAFKRDGTLNLIERLRLNVIKTGVKQMATAYSRIPIKDVAKKLNLKTVDEAEYILAKAIRDGVMEGTIDSKEKCVDTAETQDIYDTDEPQSQYHKRITFCLQLHKMAVKAMRFPPRSYQNEAESAEEQREREQQELEFAKEMHDDDEFP